MGRIIPILTACLLLAVLWTFQPPAQEADGWTIEKINETKDTLNITFEPGGGQDDSAFIKIPEDVPVYRAKIGVKGLSHTGNKFPGNSPEDEAAKNEAQSALWSLVNQLGEKHRMPIILRYVHKLSLCEISEVLRIREGTVSSRLFYACRKLEQQLVIEDVEELITELLNE